MHASLALKTVITEIVIALTAVCPIAQVGLLVVQGGGRPCRTPMVGLSSQICRVVQRTSLFELVRGLRPCNYLLHSLLKICDSLYYVYDDALTQHLKSPVINFSFVLFKQITIFFVTSECITFLSCNLIVTNYITVVIKTI